MHFDRMSTDLHRRDSVGTDHCPVQSPDRPEDAGHNVGTSKLSGQARRRPAGQSVHHAGRVPGSVPAGRRERSRTLLRPAERVEWVFYGSMLHIDHRIQSVVARASSWCQALLLAAGHFHGRTRCRHSVGSVMCAIGSVVPVESSYRACPATCCSVNCCQRQGASSRSKSFSSDSEAAL